MVQAVLSHTNGEGMMVMRRREEAKPVVVLPNGIPLSEASSDEDSCEEDASADNREKSFIQRFSPTLGMLTTFGYFPFPLQPKDGTPMTTRRKIWKSTVSCLMVLYSLILLVTNVLLGYYNIEGMKYYYGTYGILNPHTVSWIITGLKPLVNAVQFVLFNIKVFQNRKLLIQLDQVYSNIKSLTGETPNIEKTNLFFTSLVTASIGIPLGLRVFHMSCVPWNWSLLSVVSPFLVPMLTLWGLLPLHYFATLCGLMRYWFSRLRRCMRKDNRLAKRGLNEYFAYYQSLTQTLHAFGDMFNYFIAFSLAWSVLSVCLALYFVTQAPSLTSSGNNSDGPLLLVLFEIGWSAFQVVVATIFIVTIAVSGYRTNEEAIDIMNEVLEVNPREVKKADPFYIECFAHRVSTIRMWGISVLRAFPMQRSTLLTIISVMGTYAIILMKMSPNTKGDIGIKFEN